MFRIVFAVVISLAMALILCGCGDESTKPPVENNLISLGTLMDSSTEWLIVLGSSEDPDGASQVDSYLIRYNGTENPSNVVLEINEVAHPLVSNAKGIYYQFAEATAPMFTVGETYRLKLKVNNLVKAECSIKMPSIPNLSVAEGFNSAHDGNFQWTLPTNAQVQYIIGELPSGNQVIMATLAPEVRDYTYRANSLTAQTGWYEFGVVEANYNVVNNIRFCTMYAGWDKAQQTK